MLLSPSYVKLMMLYDTCPSPELSPAPSLTIQFIYSIVHE